MTRNKRNTKAIDIGANQLAAGRVLKYTAAHQLPLAEVKDKVRQQLVATQAAALAARPAPSGWPHCARRPPRRWRVRAQSSRARSPAMSAARCSMRC